MAATKVKEKIILEESTPQSELDILKAQNKSLQEQMEKQMKMMEMLMMNQSKPVEKDEMNRKVKIIHLQQPSPGLQTHISLSKLEIDFTKYGEERYLRFDDFVELTGAKFKEYWSLHILALTPEDEDLIERYQLTCADDIALQSHHLQNLPNLTIEELETLVNKLSLNHKLLITRTWANGYYVGENPEFKNRRKVEILNEVTNGGMENILSELDAERRKK